MLIHTVLRERESLSLEFEEGVRINGCEISIQRSDELIYNRHLYVAWAKHFKNNNEKVFIGIQNNLILESGSIFNLLEGLYCTGSDLVMYSTAGGAHMDINDAFFAAKKYVIDSINLIEKENCPLCAWICRVKSAGLKVCFVCDKVFKTKPVLES